MNKTVWIGLVIACAFGFYFASVPLGVALVAATITVDHYQNPDNSLYLSLTSANKQASEKPSVMEPSEKLFEELSEKPSVEPFEEPFEEPFGEPSEEPFGESAMDLFRGPSRESSRESSRKSSERAPETTQGCCAKYECDAGQPWKKCYRRRALQLHPDKIGGDGSQFKELNKCNDYNRNTVC